MIIFVYILYIERRRWCELVRISWRRWCENAAECCEAEAHQTSEGSQAQSTFVTEYDMIFLFDDGNNINNKIG